MDGFLDVIADDPRRDAYRAVMDRLLHFGRSVVGADDFRRVRALLGHDDNIAQGADTPLRPIPHL